MARSDEVLPAARDLLTGTARELLSVAVQSAGGFLRHCRTSQVLYRPGHDLVVRFDTRVDWGDGRAVDETLLACTTAAGLPDGTMRLQAGDLEVAVWRYPFDPELPGLAAAVTPGASPLVVEAVGGQPQLVVRTFRPCQRAVVEATGPSGRVFVKAARPSEVDHLVAGHTRLREAGLPVPAVLAADRTAGLVVFEALEGTTLRAALATGDLAGGGATVLDLLARLAAVPWPAARAAQPGPLAHAHGHAELLSQVLPSERARLGRLLALLDVGSSGASVAPATTTHGDLHDGQVLVDGSGTLTGLLDLDDAGVGDPIDDAARLVGHLVAMATGRTAPTRRRVDRLVAEVRAAHDTRLADLDRRIAAALVATATGPYRAQLTGWQRGTSARLALAERFAQAGERNLMHAS